MRRRQSNLNVDMFPFLSVLCSVIGVLMLFMMIIMSTRVTDAQEAAAKTRREAREQPTEATLDEGVEEETYRELAQAILVLRGTLTGLRRERVTLQELHDVLKDQLELKKIELAEADRHKGGRRQGAGLAERIPVRPRPGEQGDYKKKPIYVEVRHDGLVVQPENRSYPLKEFKQIGSPMQKFLENVYQRRDDVYLALLIHSNGMVTYQQLLETLKSELKFATGIKTEVALGGGVTRSVTTVKFHIDMVAEPFSTDWVFENPHLEQSAKP